VSGEHGWAWLRTKAQGGSSPRERGARSGEMVITAGFRIIPA